MLLVGRTEDEIGLAPGPVALGKPASRPYFRRHSHTFHHMPSGPELG